jgi:hypothetical protein
MAKMKKRRATLLRSRGTEEAMDVARSEPAAACDARRPEAM